LENWGEDGLWFGILTTIISSRDAQYRVVTHSWFAIWFGAAARLFVAFCSTLFRRHLMGTQRGVVLEEEGAMPRYILCLIFAAALLGLGVNPSIIYAQTNQQATEPNESNRPNDDNQSNEAVSPEDSTQTDQGDASGAEQPGEESDEGVGNDDAGPQDQE
jgi:hypothetical protein